MAPPIVLRKGHLKLWIHDVSQLDDVVRSMSGNTDADHLPLRELMLFPSQLVDALATTAPHIDSLHSAARELRMRRRPDLANKVNRINAASATIRHLTSDALSDVFAAVVAVFIDPAVDETAGAPQGPSRGDPRAAPPSAPSKWQDTRADTSTPPRQHGQALQQVQRLEQQAQRTAQVPCMAPDLQALRDDRLLRRRVPHRVADPLTATSARDVFVSAPAMQKETRHLPSEREPSPSAMGPADLRVDREVRRPQVHVATEVDQQGFEYVDGSAFCAPCADIRSEAPVAPPASGSGHDLMAILSAITQLGDGADKRIAETVQLLDAAFQRIDGLAHQLALLRGELDRLPTRRGLDRCHAALRELGNRHLHSHSVIHRRIDDIEGRLDGQDLFLGRELPPPEVAGAPPPALVQLELLDAEAWRCLRAASREHARILTLESCRRRTDEFLARELPSD